MKLIKNILIKMLTARLIKGFALIFVLAPIITACSISPPKPKKPNESRWIPVNKTIPAEIERGAI